MCLLNKDTEEHDKACPSEPNALENMELQSTEPENLGSTVTDSEDPAEYRINLRAVTPQGNVFLDAFELRYTVKIPLEGRRQFIHLAATGKLKTVIKYALAQPMAALTRFGDISLLEMPKPPEGYEDYSGYGRFLIMDLLKLNSTHRMRLYSRLTEVNQEGNPTVRAIKSCFDLTQMKNICPKLIFQDVIDSIKDHHDTLTNSDNPEVSLRVERIVNHISQVIFPPLIRFKDLPPGKLTDRSALLQQYLPGTGLETQKLKSGSGFKATVSDIKDYRYEWCKKRKQEVKVPYKTNSVISYSLALDTLYSMSYEPKEKDHVHDPKHPVLPNGRVLSLLGLPPRSDYELDILEKFYNTEEYPIEDGTAAVVGLLEPLKVRTISIDSGILRYLASRLQKYLWKILAQYPIFDLIKGVKVEDTIDFLVAGLGFVSGDYKGATDSIFHNSTDLWVDQIFKRLAYPPHLEEHFNAIKSEFTRVLLDYSDVYNQEGIPWLKAYVDELKMPTAEEDWYGNFYEVFGKISQDLAYYGHPQPDFKNLLEENTIVRQARGQLMGNVLSFPILCLINLTGYLNAAEEYINEFADMPVVPDSERNSYYQLYEFFQPHYSPKRGYHKYRLSLSKKSFGKLPVRVNGDDILFQASSSFYHIWSKSLKEVGFVKSVGKNYFSDQFFTINSQIFVPQRSKLMDVSGQPFFIQPQRLNHIWWAGLMPDFLRKRADYVWLMGAPAARIADARSILGPMQAFFLSTVPSRQRKTWNSAFLTNMKEFIESFDSFGLPLYSLKEWKKLGKALPIPLGKFAVSRSLPVSLGGLGLELNEPEILTYSQKVLAGRLSLDSESLPNRLGESPQIQWVIRMYRKYLSNTVRTEKVPLLEYQRRLIENPLEVERLQDYVIRRAAALYPFWRTPPPDDISFSPFELRRFTEDSFKWALTIRRSLKESFVRDLQYIPPMVELILYASPSSVTLDEGVVV